MEFEGYTDKKDEDYVTVTTVTYQTSIREDVKAFILGYLKDGEKETTDLDSMMKATGASKGALEGAKTKLKKNGQIVYFSRGFKPKAHYCELTNPMPSETMRE